MKADTVTGKEVMDVLNRFADYYCKCDLEGLLSTIASDPDVFVFCAGQDDKCAGIDEIKTQFKHDWLQFDAPSLEFTWTSISAAGSVAWVAANTLYKMTIKGNNLIFTCSVTMVLEKREGKWVIVHIHYSVPVEELPHSDAQKQLSTL
ncbi:nuclear transport factor 2 family protein [Methanosarcina sp.]|uniref:nuclear transport factor 2 family protein n=1 Tax=Methanosarcina sp. TaxID=2213 RepID=UPI003BB4EED6